VYPVKISHSSLKLRTDTLQSQISTFDLFIFIIITIHITVNIITATLNLLSFFFLSNLQLFIQ
jgi:hypothetical protein